MNPAWAKLETPKDVYHVVPVNDTKDHDDGFHCWCKPRIETYENGNSMVSHNAADGREFFEQEVRGAGH